jgi:histidyl-tRNA synthetase
LDFSLPRGIRDVEPDEESVYERIRAAFFDVADLFNFRKMEPAPIENLSTLTAKSGEDIVNEIYSFKDKGGREVGLRFDLTVGLARFVASRKDLKPPVKLACYGGVWRYDEPQHARYRWFHQWDMEIFGTRGLEADAEIIDASRMLFEKLDLKRTLIKVGDRRIVEEFLRKKLLVHSEEKLNEMLKALDKVGKKSRTQLIQEYQKKGIAPNELDQLIEFGTIRGSPGERVSKLASFELQSAESLVKLWEQLESRGIKNAEYDLSIVRGIDYYDGIVFEIVDRDHPDLGSLCGGGRYDSLPRILGRPDLTATGAAGGVERIALSMKGAKPVSSRLVYVVFTEETFRDNALRLATEFRSEGITTDFTLQMKSLGRQLEDADQAGAEWVVIVGKQEVTSGKYILKDMRARTESHVSPEDLKRRLSRVTS